MTPALAIAVTIAAILTVLLGAALVGALLGRSAKPLQGNWADDKRPVKLVNSVHPAGNTK